MTPHPMYGLAARSLNRRQIVSPARYARHDCEYSVTQIPPVRLGVVDHAEHHQSTAQVFAGPGYCTFIL